MDREKRNPVTDGVLDRQGRPIPPRNSISDIFKAFSRRTWIIVAAALGFIATTTTIVVNVQSLNTGGEKAINADGPSVVENFSVEVNYQNSAIIIQLGQGVTAIIEHRDAPKMDQIVFRNIAGVANTSRGPFRQLEGMASVDSKIGNSFFIKASSGKVWGGNVKRPEKEHTVYIDFFIPYQE
jgi:hypothetical protein